ncbi:MAG TPA: hypothetical protein VK968_09280 [Roseimicrobium sp.]|nr:hypothetical protein [Roseimicrobium sp.]
MPTRRSIPVFRALLGLALLFSLSSPSASEAADKAGAPGWWKGNLHTHSLWSDGDDFPEMITEYYKSGGYNFLMFSDHNVMQVGEHWMNPLKTNRYGRNFGTVALDKYLKRFGPGWVEQKTEQGTNWVRVKPMDEYRGLFEESGRFLLMSGSEITDRYKTAPVHMGGINLRETVKPNGGDSVLAVIQANVDSVLEQRQRTGQPMFPHLNHPNFQWGVTAEEFMSVKGISFFEVYNGHHMVHNEGDETHAGTERVWDIVLTKRLAELNLGVMYGLATDDTHNYHTNAIGLSNGKRGWIVVRSPHLTPESLVRSMEAGDFYASSGVELKDVTRKEGTLSVEVNAQPGVKYTIQFIGTRKGYNPKSEPVKTANGENLRVTHRYSDDIGKVLAEIQGTKASYALKGDEIYVRARIVSTKVKENPYVAGEFEQAWTQPLVGPASAKR